MRSPCCTARTSRATARSMSLRCERVGQEPAQGRLEEIRHVVELDLARRQQPADRIGQAVALRHGEGDALVAEPLGPAPAGQRVLDAEEGRAGGRFGGHAVSIAQSRRFSPSAARDPCGSVKVPHFVRDDTSLVHHRHSNGQTRTTAILMRRARAPPICRVSGSLLTSTSKLWRTPGHSRVRPEASSRSRTLSWIASTQRPPTGRSGSGRPARSRW